MNDSFRPSISEVRLRNLARRVHSLGERPLYELFRELLAGADPLSRIEIYADLDADLVHALGASDFPPPLIVAGSAIRGGRHV